MKEFLRKIKKGGVSMPDNIDELVKAEKREYYKKWREKNKEKIKESNRKYWENRANRKSAEKNKA